MPSAIVSVKTDDLLNSNTVKSFSVIVTVAVKSSLVVFPLVTVPDTLKVSLPSPTRESSIVGISTFTVV